MTVLEKLDQRCEMWKTEIDRASNYHIPKIKHSYHKTINAFSDHLPSERAYYHREYDDKVKAAQKRYRDKIKRLKMEQEANGAYDKNLTAIHAELAWK